MDLNEAYNICSTITRKEAKNFYYAFLTLPRIKRRAIYVIYAFCRFCDDIADGDADVDDDLVLEDAWRRGRAGVNVCCGVGGGGVEKQRE